ncbi:MAG: SMI1/KNR4 family protein [Butyrivibrio sp.]|uniref:SMI1/KNR4 family protein n=1 Tax=Butyrivibrio sp. TaxID=28121 RepID=UPI0025D180CA|nr:SMI1/KNR4 family protein [Butyrivibrio sp.]MCR5771710.1 SMI1/KNR4 family protein [Butyrivibrio sp.]
MIFCDSIIKENITEELMKKRETVWRRELPKSFKAFIKKNNGGIPTERIIIKGTFFVERFFGMVSNVSESKDGVYDINYIISKNDVYMVFDEDTVGTDLIPFAQLNHDAMLCLCYKNDIPSVVIWSMDGSLEFNPNVETVFESFDAFLEAYK